MNTPTPTHSEELRYAEYVLGVLDAEARAAVEREVLVDEAAAAAVTLWQRHLTPLHEDVAPAPPPAYVWVRIREAVGLSAMAAPARPTALPQSRPGWWNSLPFWRGIGTVATLAAAASFALWFVRPAATPPAPSAAHYLVASIARDDGIAGWTATIDPQRQRVVIVPAAPAHLAAGRSAELWLVPPGSAPISLGVIRSDRPTTVQWRPLLAARVTDKALLAVSDEPLGGSPTGQPTGPIIAKGPIGGT